MPALPFVTDVVRVDLVQLIGADLDVLNRFHMDFSGATTSALLDTWASGINTAWGAHLAALAPDQVQLTNVIVTDLSSDISPQGNNATVQSGSRGSGLSAAASLVASLEISRRYRGGHPRLYFPFGVDTDLASAQAWSGTFVGVAQTAINTFMADALSAAPSGITPIGWVNVSYYKGFTNVMYPSGRTRPRPTVRAAAVTDGVNSIIVRASVGSQRRRNQFQS